MTIKYAEVIFDDPIPIDQWRAPSDAGIYAIVLPDPACFPKPYKVIYFGESRNLADHHLIEDFENNPPCQRYTSGQKNLYIAVHLMPNSSTEQRLYIKSHLLNKYKPVCNRKPLKQMTNFFKNALRH